MTVKRFHGTEGTDPEQEVASEIPNHNYNYNMSLTYSDFLYALPPLQEPPTPPRAPPNPRQPQPQPQPSSSRPQQTSHSNIARQRSYTHSGSSSSLFNLGSPSSYLPYEFQVLEESTVPLLQNAEERDADFVLIAEFSELEGPIPLCTIPYDAPFSRTDINLNSLSVHLMSTDYQVNSVGHFKVCEDTQVMRTNVFPHVHVFMQYFTLYDIKARGFVRPFCFGYVSKDHVKLSRNIQSLSDEFNQISKVLKCANRLWFAEELSSYMNKLSSAKDNFISRTSPPEDGEGEDGHFYFETGEQGADPISLSQIAFQFTEIENILTAVRSVQVDPGSISELHTLESTVNSNPGLLRETLSKLNFLGDSFPSLCMPLVHPLKQKGESLRPITTLGQFGTMYLVQELMNIYGKHRVDLIFTEMAILTQDFRTHCKQSKSQSPETDIQPSSESEPDPVRASAPTNRLNEGSQEILCKIIEKLHASVPILHPDDQSGSYHSLSDESDIQFPGGKDSNGSVVENDPRHNTSVCGSVDSSLNQNLPGPSTFVSSKVSDSVPKSSDSRTKKQISKKLSTATKEKENEQKASALSSLASTPMSGPPPRLSLGYSSEEENSPKTDPPPVTEASTEIEIEKISWWVLAAKTKIVRGDAGYDIWKFFRRFFKIGHHILFSILMGRPVIICASTKLRQRVKNLIFALLPFVPSYPSKSFKILPWHQGTLSPLNFRHSYKLIGLCIPERSNIHDLVHSTEQNTVTVLDFEAKKIMGPAYSGNYLKNFEELVCQKKFFDDLSVLTYLGSIFAELESQVFMFKTMQCDGEENVVKIMKQLGLKNSDAEIVKHLGSLITEPHEGVELF